MSREPVEAESISEEENDENVPPTGRRSQRIKGRKGASKFEQDDEDEDEEQIDEETDDVIMNHEEDEDDEEEEEKRSRKRARKSGPTKSKPRGKANGAAKGSKAKKPRKSKASDTVMEESTAECPMLDALLDDKVALDATIIEWIDRYTEDETAATTEIVNFILRCCGCPFEIRSEDVDDEDNIADNLAEIQEAYKKTNPREYPLISTKKTVYRKFPKRLSEFFRRLLLQLSGKGMLDTDRSVLTKLNEWIFSLSSTNFRPFRHTATSISLGCITTLCDIYAKINKQFDTHNVLLEKEKKSKKSTKVKEVEKIAKALESQLQKLSELMETTYDSVFVHRFRDVDYHIRTECVHELGLWMQLLPQIYFDGAHLRYMGWALSDSHSTTRLDVVKSLQKLYSSDTYLPNLRHFTERFLSRFIEMATSDADRSVRVATIVLLDHIRERELLENEDLDKICCMIFDAEGRVRRAVVSCVVSVVEGAYEELCEGIGRNVDAVEKELGDEKDRTDGVPSTWLRFKALCQVLLKYDKMVEEAQADDQPAEDKFPFKGLEFGDVESRISMAATALVSEMEELQDWDNIALYLLADHSSRPTEKGRNAGGILAKARRAAALDASEETILLEVLNASVLARRTYEDDHEDTKGKKRKRGDSEPAEDNDRVDVSTGLVKHLPPLLHRFGSKPDTAALILKLIPSVNLDKYNELRQDEALEFLLEDVGKQFMNHTSGEVFREVGNILLHAQKAQEVGFLVEGRILELQDEVNSAFSSMVNGKNLAVDALAPEEIEDLTTAVARLENLLSVSDCTLLVSDSNTKQGKSTFDLLTILLERSITLHDAEEIGLISHALRAIRWYFMWRVRTVTGPEGKRLDDLTEKRDTVLDILKSIVQSRPAADEIKVQAMTLLVDLYTICTSAESDLSSFDTKIPMDVQDLIINLLEEEINLLHSTSKKAPKVPNGDTQEDGEDDEDEEDEDEEMRDIPPETREAIHEKRLCEIAARVVLAILAGSLPKPFAEQLLKHKGRVGQSYDRILLELGISEPKNVTKKSEKKVIEHKEPVVEEEERVMEDVVEVAGEGDQPQAMDEEEDI